jgi:protein-S-isoprenylcysteine O-methyltransferase Ste14
MKGSYFIKHLAGSLLFFLILFIGAGRLVYWQGLIYVAISLIMVSLNYTVLRPDPGLLRERSKPAEGTRKWDKQILAFSFLVTVAMYLSAGLDSGRYRWSPDFHWSLPAAGIVLTASGQLLFLVAQKQNKFFSSTVRIQTDRGQTVCDKGLYKVVRHPAYLGSDLQAVGFPLLMGSLWSIIPAAILLILTIIRTHLEDQTLKRELKGYPEYAEKTRYRIIPFAW